MLNLLIKSPIFRGASWYLLEKLIRLVGAFLIGAWVARYLGPEVYGTLAFALSIVSVLGFLASLGVETIVIRDLIERPEDRRQILATYLFIRIAGGLLAPLIAVTYLMYAHAEDRLLIIFASLFGGAVIFGAYDAADCWLQATKQARITSLIRIAGFFVGAIGRCFLIVYEAAPMWFAVIFMIESAFIAALYHISLSRNKLAPSLRYFRGKEARELIVSGRMMILSGFTVSVYTKLDLIFVGSLLSKEEIGTYAVAASMCGAWNMVGTSMAQAWGPRLTESRSAGMQNYLRQLRALIFAMISISILGSLVLMLFSTFIFEFFFGSAFLPGAEIFQLLVWSSVPIFIGIATSQIIVNERVYWVSLLRTSVNMLIYIILFVPAVLHFGAMGAAAVVVIGASIAVPMVLFSRQARRVIFSMLKYQESRRVV